MWMRTKDKLIGPKCNEGDTTSGSRSFQESPNLIGKLCVPIAKTLPQLCLHGLLLSRKLNVGGVNIAKNGEQQLIGYIL